MPGLASSFLSFLALGLVLQKYHLVSFTSVLFLWPSLLIQFIYLWQGRKDVGRKFLSQSLLNLFHIAVLHFMQDKGQQSSSAKCHSPLVNGDTLRRQELGMKTNLITGISHSFELSS